MKKEFHIKFIDENNSLPYILLAKFEHTLTIFFFFFLSNWVDNVLNGFLAHEYLSSLE